MSAVIQGKVFIDKYIMHLSEAPSMSDNRDISDAQDFDVDFSRFKAGTLDSAPSKEVYGHPRMRPGGQIRVQWSNWHSDNGRNL